MNIERELQKIIKEAEKALRAANKVPGKTEIKVSKEAKRLGTKYRKYKELAGKKRLSKEEKYALLQYTPKQVVKARGMTDEQLKRRQKSFERMTGKKVSDYDVEELRYKTPAKLAAEFGYVKEERTPSPQEIKDTRYPDLFTPVKLPEVQWESLPYGLRRGRQRRRGRGFLYLNADIFFTGGMVDLQRLLLTGVDGDTDSVISFLRNVPAISAAGILIDPGHTGDRFAVLEKEWKQGKELSPDYTVTRRYKKILIKKVEKEG